MPTLHIPVVSLLSSRLLERRAGSRVPRWRQATPPLPLGAGQAAWQRHAEALWGAPQGGVTRAEAGASPAKLVGLFPWQTDGGLPAYPMVRRRTCRPFRNCPSLFASAITQRFSLTLTLQKWSSQSVSQNDVPLGSQLSRIGPTAGFGILNPGRCPEYRNATPGVRIPPGRELRPLQVPRAPGGFS